MAKRGIKKKKKRAGRKLFDGKNAEVVLQKLEQVFGIDGTDEEACFFADISPSALYEYQKRHPKFLERKQALKHGPVLKARKAVIDGLTGDAEFSLKYLERKLPDEFGIRQKIEHKGAGITLTTLVNIVNGNNNDKKEGTKTGERISKKMF